MQVRRHIAHPEAAVRRPLDPPRGEDPHCVAVDQQRQQQARVILRLAARDRPHRESPERHPIHRCHYEVCHVVRRQPVLGIRRQQKSLLAAERNEPCHARQIRRFQTRWECDRMLALLTAWRDAREPSCNLRRNMAEGLLTVRATLRDIRPTAANCCERSGETKTDCLTPTCDGGSRFRAAYAPSMTTCTTDDVRSEQPDLLKVMPRTRGNRSGVGGGGGRTGGGHSSPPPGTPPPRRGGPGG